MHAHRFSLVAVLLVGCGKSSSDVAEDPPAGADPNAWVEQDWCASLGDLSAVADAHDASRLRETLEDLSAIRYPPALGFIDAQTDAELARWFFSGTSTFDGVMDGYEVAVHEGAHIWGFGEFSFDSYSYRVIDDTLVIETAYLDNFPRSEILARHPYPDSDFYADTYLTGSSGNQGFNTVLDEFNAYAHSLASRFCTRDYIPGSTSARDGILTFMLYVELYLKTAREDHPDDYDEILADPAHTEAILAIWDRATHWLNRSEGMTELGIDDAMIAEHVYDPVNFEEIERLR